MSQVSNGFLSQEEIDSLLRGEVPGDGANEVASTAPAEEPLLSDVEKDALGELGNISMGSAATTLSVLLGRRVQ
ncbi:MAG: chemotaxis protein CheC, partial [Bacillota bacterium]